MAAALSATGDYGTPTLEQSYVFSIYAGSGSDDVNPTVLLGQHTLTIGDNTETPLQKDKPLIFKREGNVLKLVHKNERWFRKYLSWCYWSLHHNA